MEHSLAQLENERLGFGRMYDQVVSDVQNWDIDLFEDTHSHIQ